MSSLCLDYATRAQWKESQSDRERTQLGVNFRILIEKDALCLHRINLVAISLIFRSPVILCMKPKSLQTYILEGDREMRIVKNEGA